ncbi:unnamed protein product, partial [Mesorhabditis spiculigera]
MRLLLLVSTFICCLLFAVCAGKCDLSQLVEKLDADARFAPTHPPREDTRFRDINDGGIGFSMCTIPKNLSTQMAIIMCDFFLAQHGSNGTAGSGAISVCHRAPKLRQHWRAQPKKWAGKFPPHKFFISRDPIDRFLSTYLSLCIGRNECSGKTVGQMAKIAYHTYRDVGKKGWKGPGSRYVYHHFEPQTRFCPATLPHFKYTSNRTQLASKLTEVFKRANIPQRLIKKAQSRILRQHVNGNTDKDVKEAIREEIFDNCKTLKYLGGREKAKEIKGAPRDSRRDHATMQRYITYGSLDADPLYNCRNITDPRKYQGEPAVISGFFYAAYGMMSQLGYMLALSVIKEKEFLSMSCYKLMFALGILDSLCVIISCEYTGYLLAIGAWYCMYPNAIYLGGVWIDVIFNACCFLCLMLVLNRFLDFWKPHIGEMFFKGNRTWGIIALGFGYGLLYLWTPPILFHWDYGTWIYNPLIPGNDYPFASIYQTLNNTCICLGVCLLYTAIYFLYRAKMRSAKVESAAFQRQLLIQSVLVCLFTFTTTTIWASLVVIPPTKFIMHIGHLSWQLMHGTPAFIYLFMNKTIQRRVLHKLFKNQIGSTTAITTAKNPQSRYADSNQSEARTKD